MATNLSDLGFTAQAGLELETLARKCYRNGHASRCAQGLYIAWSPGNGIELWAQLNLREELLGLNPHFAGKTRLSAGLMERVMRAGFPMDGGFRALALPYGSAPLQGAFQFVFDVPDFLLHDGLGTPVIHSLQLAAFAQQCAIFENEEELQSRTSRLPFKLASDSFLPVGMWGQNREPLAEPLPSALFCGLLLDTALLKNPLSKASFWWLKAKTAAGDVDVVADPELLPLKPRPGRILQCTAWLSGKLVD